MKAVLVVTADEALRGNLQRAFPACSVFVAASDADALKTLRFVEVDVVFRDSRSPVWGLASFVSRVRELSPATLVVAIGPAEDEAGAADYAVSAACSARELETVLRQVDDRQRLLREVVALRHQLAPQGAPARAGDEASREPPALGRVLKEFARVFAAGFHLPKVLELFLDAVGELLRPARAALLLPDESGDVYRVHAHRGLPPQVVEAVRLSAAQGLARWLTVQGRPARLYEVADPGLSAELRLLGGLVAVPLLAHGELAAILVVGPPVVGGTYSRSETEILFDLATQLGTAIRHITLHQRLQQEKEFNERILAHMSSGVVTIGRDERVGVVNRRAAEILGLSAADLVGHDLRALPSPLGDMLYETLACARALPRSEVHLPLRNLWLEAATSPIWGDGTTPVGAVLVFEDQTAHRQLAAQRRQAEEVQLLARVIARIADEIKNPLVSINTFVELIDERFEDPDFRKLFSSVVRRDVRRMVQVFEKLAGLVGEGEVHFTTVDAQAVLDEVAASADLSDDPGKRVHVEVTGERTSHLVKVDPAQFRRALTYLVRYLGHKSPTDEARVALSVTRHAERDGGGAEIRIQVGSRTATVPPDQLEHLFDPVRMVQEGLVDVGPAVSQRLVEAVGGRLRVRQGRHELAFQISLPAVS
jgi:PAS domain S-box-containing protein